MTGRNTSIVNRLSKKNIKDTIILGIVTILIVAIVIFVENKTVMIISAIATLLIYYVQYQLSRNDLVKSIDKLIDNELKEFQKISSEILLIRYL